MSNEKYTVEQVRAIASQIKNHHILEVSFVGHSEHKPTRMKISSARFKESVLISYNHDYPNTFEGAIEWLLNHNFEIVGQGEGKDCYYIITTTFKPLK